MISFDIVYSLLGLSTAFLYLQGKETPFYVQKKWI